MIPKSTTKCDQTNEETELIDLDQMLSSLNSGSIKKMSQTDLQQIYSRTIAQEKSLTFHQMIYLLAREIYGSSDSIGQILNSNSEILGDDFNINILNSSQNIYNYSTSTNDHIMQDIRNIYERDILENKGEQKDYNNTSNHNDTELMSMYSTLHNNVSEVQDQELLPEPIIDLGPSYVNGKKVLENSHSRFEEPDEIIIQRRPLITETQNSISPADKENKSPSRFQARPQQSSYLASNIQTQNHSDSHHIKTVNGNVSETFLRQEHQREEIKTEESALDFSKFPEAVERP
ncbi:13262_t:CDS:2 [Dentiscutata erythropus]|uniref:13262_t:CDS:1 n=1 Tax=Dentiscutata erythropus TaxID=1348616 RepID=A0A9N9HSN0_9GLOM|nr:13262_t:CDS:2 [Dentiscutata erythropus]